MSWTPDAGAGGSWQRGDRVVHRLGLGAMRLTGTAPFHSGSPADRGTSLEVLRRARELGVDHLDTAAFYFRAEDDLDVGEHVAALADLVDAGLVRHVGVSAVGTEQLEQALAVTAIVSVQNRFSLDDRAEFDVLERCGELGIAFVPYFALTRPDPSRAAFVGSVAVELGASPAQVRLAYTLSLGAHVLAIPGTGDPDHPVENVAAAAVRLDDNQLRRLHGEPG